MHASTNSMRITKGRVSALMGCLMVCLQTGCATLDMRFGKYPDEVKSTFPSTRRVYRIIENRSRVKPPQVSDMGSAFFAAVIMDLYPVSELPPAIVTDLLLWPMDFYFASTKASRKCDARDALSEKQEGKHEDTQQE